MSVEENKAAFRRIPEEVINSGNLDLADEVFAPDYVDHAPVPPGVPGGLEGFKAFFTNFAFPAFCELRRSYLLRTPVNSLRSMRQTPPGGIMNVPYATNMSVGGKPPKSSLSRRENGG